MASKATNSLIGVAIAVSANVCISLALNLQKLAHQKLQVGPAPPPLTPLPRPPPPSSESTPLIPFHARPGRDQSLAQLNSPAEPGYSLSYLRSPTWWTGFVLMSAGELGNFISYGFAPASVVAPLGTVALVTNCVFAPVVLGERFHRRDIAGIALAIIGTATIVLISPRSAEVLMPVQLLAALGQPAFLVYAGLSLLSIVTLVCLSATKAADRFVAIDLGLCAILGGFTVLSTKAFSSLLNTLFLSCFRYPITWFMVILMVVTAIGQVGCLNRALQRFDAKLVVPVQFVMFTTVSIIGSTILYGDLKRVGTAELGNFGFACVFIFTGVYVLTRADGGEEEVEIGSGGGLGTVPEEEGIEEPDASPVRVASRFLPRRSTSGSQSDQAVLPRRSLRRQRSQPIMFPRASGTPGYYLIPPASAANGTLAGFRPMSLPRSGPLLGSSSTPAAVVVGKPTGCDNSSTCQELRSEDHHPFDDVLVSCSIVVNHPDSS